MRFSCEKALLQSAIMTAARAVSPKSTIPALEGACDKINYIDVSPVFADAIQRIYEENSMSVLF